MHAIEAVELNKKFRHVEALRHLNLCVDEGSIYALMGPNGAGKTTLIKILMNLMSPTTGRAVLFGESAGLLQGRRLENIGYVSENQKLPDWMTVPEFLNYWRPFYPSWDRALESRLTKRFDLPRKQKLKSLSRGMKMKAALTSALVYRPRLVILDEPLSGLDPLVRDDLMESLLEMVGETTVLFSSHDLAEVDNFATHVGYIDGGRLLLSDAMPSVRERFRAVAVSSTAPLPAPSSLPAEWLQYASEEMSARWNEIDFHAERSYARAREIFGPVELSSTPLTLRQVFLTLARANRPPDKNGSRP
jgi:ABC-2 type transport system ATP-binding protein